MTTGSTGDTADALSVEAINRAEALAVLDGDGMTRADLMDSLGVSRTTVHRLVRDLEELDFLTDDGDRYVLTPLGRAIRRATETYRDAVSATVHLEPLLTALGDCDVALDVEAFASATVTVAEQGDPYGPVNRFTELLDETTSLRGFDTASVSPTYAEDIQERILDGLSVELVYESAVVERIAGQYPDLAAAAFERETIDIRIHDDVPFGLALFEQRVGIGAYDDRTGQLLVFVDSDDPAAYAWGEQLFERYRDEATAK